MKSRVPAYLAVGLKTVSSEASHRGSSCFSNSKKFSNDACASSPSSPTGSPRMCLSIALCASVPASAAASLVRL